MIVEVVPASSRTPSIFVSILGFMAGTLVGFLVGKSIAKILASLTFVSHVGANWFDTIVIAGLVLYGSLLVCIFGGGVMGWIIGRKLRVTPFASRVSAATVVLLIVAISVFLLSHRGVLTLV